MNTLKRTENYPYLHYSMYQNRKILEMSTSFTRMWMTSEFSGCRIPSSCIKRRCVAHAQLENWFSGNTSVNSGNPDSVRLPELRASILGFRNHFFKIWNSDVRPEVRATRKLGWSKQTQYHLLIRGGRSAHFTDIHFDLAAVLHTPPHIHTHTHLSRVQNMSQPVRLLKTIITHWHLSWRTYSSAPHLSFSNGRA